MIFGTWNPEKIWHQKPLNSPTSPVSCSHFTLGNPKKSFSTILLMRAYDYLRYLGIKLGWHDTGFIILFTDDNVFTVTPPMNSQNDPLYCYASLATTKRDIGANTRSTFIKSLMVFVAVWNWAAPTIETCCWCRGCSICIIAGDVFVFQQDNAPVHRAPDTVELLRHETRQFISPGIWTTSSPDLVDYRIWAMMQERVSSTDPLYGRFAAAACWDMGWISAERGGRRHWSVANRLEACVHAVGGHFEHLLWRCLSHITTVSFQSHQHLEENSIPSIRWTSSAFHKVVRWHYFQMWWASLQPSRLSLFYSEITEMFESTY